MHPAFVTAIAAARQQDKLARAAASRRARQARQAQAHQAQAHQAQAHPARPGRPGSQPEPGPRHAVRRQHGPAEPLCPAAPSPHDRQKVGA